MWLSTVDWRAVLSHLVSGVTLAVVAYIANRVRVLFHRFSDLPSRMDDAEKKIEHHHVTLEGHGSRLSFLEDQPRRR